MKIQAPIIIIYLIFITLFVACSKKDAPPESGKPTPTVTTPTLGNPSVPPIPLFTDFSPQTAFIGDTITITGQHLGTDSTALSIKFGTVQAKVISAAETSAKVIVPDDIDQPSAKITLTSGTTEITSAMNFHLKAPIIQSISYTSGFAGQLLFIYGKGFRNTNHFSQISFGNIIITGASTGAGHIELTFNVPDGLLSGKYPITITIAGLTAIAPQEFEIFVPSITSFTPHSAKRNATIVINGINLKNPNRDNTRVSFIDFKTGVDLKSAYIGIVTSTSIEAFVPDNLRAGATYRIIVSVVGSTVKTTEAFTCIN
ncbi:MAG: cell surface receptor domain protein [Mucilaginibacter sp.]|nr:cell surface receptor domain protein [Mucilaginibacter sp.]